MDKRTIIFRADGGPTIGMGHFIRSLALAEMLNEHFICVFATQKPSAYQVTEIEKVCHHRIDLPAEDSHYSLFLEQLTGNEIVVLDNYYFNTDYQYAIKAKGCKLVCIDDMHDKHYVADIVINHAEGITANVFSIEPSTKLLLGYRYALIRNEFRTTFNINFEKKYTCLIMMGGTDPLGITNQIIDILQEFNFEKPIAVVSGITQKNSPSAVGGKFKFFDKLNAKEVSRLMMESDFGILPASTVAIEACATRLPFICGYFVNNQLEVYNSIKKEQLAICIGDFRTIDSGILISEIENLFSPSIRDVINKKQEEIIDNKSRHRYMKIFSQL